VGYPLRELLSAVEPADPALRDVAAELHSELDDLARELTAGLPADRLPIRLPKGRVTNLLRCERYAEALAGPRMRDSAARAVVLGMLVDRLVHHHVLAGATDLRGRELLDACAEALVADGEIHAIDDHDWFVERLDLAADALAQDWPVVEDAWWPRCEATASTDLADGAVRVQGRMDVVFGGAPTTRPLVVVEVKSRDFRGDDRADLWWYSLMAAWAWNEVPPLAVGWSALQRAAMPEHVRVQSLEAAFGRAATALRRAAEIAAGRAPRETPTPDACPHCPVADRCDAGLAFLRHRDRDDDVLDW
jgi:hypothetical protein